MDTQEDNWLGFLLGPLDGLIEFLNWMYNAQVICNSIFENLKTLLNVTNVSSVLSSKVKSLNEQIKLLGEKWLLLSSILKEGITPNCLNIIAWYTQIGSNFVNDKISLVLFAKMNFINQEEILLELLKLTNLICKNLQIDPTPELITVLERFKNLKVSSPKQNFETWKSKREIYLDSLIQLDKEFTNEEREKLEFTKVEELLEKLQLNNQIYSLNRRNKKLIEDKKLILMKMKFIDEVGLVKLANYKFSPDDEPSLNLIFKLIQFKEKEEWKSDKSYKDWIKTTFLRISNSKKKIKEILLEDLKTNELTLRTPILKRNYNMLMETNKIKPIPITVETNNAKNVINLAKNDVWIKYKDLLNDLNLEIKEFRDENESSVEVKHLQIPKLKLK